jgi:hypothetical protein
MAYEFQKVEYFKIIVQSYIAKGSNLLTAITEAGVDFLAYKAIPLDSTHTQFTLFPIDSTKLLDGAKKAEMKIEGPYSAVIIKGDEKPGALAEIYKKLSHANIQVKESSGMAHINGGYGVILYLQPEDSEKAIAILRK